MKDVLMGVIKSNIVYLILALLTIGGLIATLKASCTRLDSQEQKIVELFKKSADLKIETTTVSVKLDTMQTDLKEIKGDVKRLLYKPQVTDEFGHDTKIASAAIVR